MTLVNLHRYHELIIEVYTVINLSPLEGVMAWSVQAGGLENPLAVVVFMRHDVAGQKFDRCGANTI